MSSSTAPSMPTKGRRTSPPSSKSLSAGFPVSRNRRRTSSVWLRRASITCSRSRAGIRTRSRLALKWPIPTSIRCSRRKENNHAGPAGTRPPRRNDFTDPAVRPGRAAATRYRGHVLRRRSRPLYRFLQRRRRYARKDNLRHEYQGGQSAKGTLSGDYRLRPKKAERLNDGWLRRTWGGWYRRRRGTAADHRGAAGELGRRRRHFRRSRVDHQLHRRPRHLADQPRQRALRRPRQVVRKYLRVDPRLSEAPQRHLARAPYRQHLGSRQEN